MALQLALWLEDADREATLLERLVQLRPTDGNIAMLQIERREASGDATPEEIDALYAQLIDRFPDNADIRIRRARMAFGAKKFDEVLDLLLHESVDQAAGEVQRYLVDAAVETDRYRELLAFERADANAFAYTLASSLMNKLRHADAIALIKSLDVSAEEAPALWVQLSSGHFALHQFDEAKAALDAIPEDAEMPADAKTMRTQMRPWVDDYLTKFWPAEQVIRSSEAGVDDLPRVRIVTARGPIVVELFENEAPNTVANFISLTESGFYVGTKFHRYMQDFMIQGGDPNTKEGAEGRPGSGGPGYSIPDEHTLDNHRMHFRDSLAMAKTPAPNTAGSGFYINHRPTPWLNGKHTVFGRVIEGLDIAHALQKDDEILEMTVLRKRDREYTPTTMPKP
jgi:cyclophilin family peptidyl-prolyl cis-trans isomerase